MSFTSLARSRTIFSLYVFGVFTCFAWLYGFALVELWQRWTTQAEYGHGIVIVAFSLFVFWQRRGRFSFIKVSWRWLSLIGLGFALAALLVAKVTALFFVAHLSLLLALTALLVSIWGTRVLVSFSFPLFFLAFSIPTPYFLEAALTAKLQLISSDLAVGLIRSLAIPVYQSGNVIDLGDVQLEVVEACSGLRYLYPLLGLGVLLAYLYKAPLWRRLFVVASTIPITVIMNSFRIAMTAWLVENIGVEAAEGFFHDFEGILVFSLCLVTLFIEITFIEWVFSRRSLWAALDLDALDSQGGQTFEASNIKLNWVPVAFIGMLLAGIGLNVYLDSRSPSVRVVSQLQLMPLDFGQWRGNRVDLHEYKLQRLKVDDYAMINYQAPSYDQPINFYVAFYREQKSGQSPHSPKVCIPGGGWVIKSIDRVDVNQMSVNQIVIGQEGDRQLVNYWFVERGRAVVDEYERKWYLLRDALRWQRTDGALIRVTTPLGQGESVNSAQSRLTSFIGQVELPLMSYLPAPPGIVER